MLQAISDIKEPLEEDGERWSHSKGQKELLQRKLE